MSTTPGSVVSTLVAATRQRLALRAALHGAAVAIFAAALLLLVSRLMRATGSSIALDIALLVVVVAIGATIGWWQSRSARANAARTLDALVPASRNLLVTAHELATGVAATTDAAVATLVSSRADAIARSVSLDSVLPLRPSMLSLAGGLAVWALTATFVHSAAPSAIARGARTIAASAAGRVEITGLSARITAPTYAQRYTSAASRTLQDPTRVDALQGSTIAFTLNAVADTLVAVTRDSSGEHTVSLAPTSKNEFTLTVPATADSYVAFEPRGANGRSGARRLVVISARPDASPRVRIVDPAKDLVVPDAKRTLAIRVQADDDLALGSLTLKYTKVSGSGERFTFSEGTIPVAVSRTSGTDWSARASLALEPLLTEPGDLVVYRAVATDTRPGSAPVESDAFIAELAAQGGVAALGFSVDPDEDRYALSQQMVILKTERLIARKNTLAPQALADEAAQIAAEQRRVRAEFVFMMGGEFAQETTGETGEELDESAEAEAESDLSAGRMVNRGRTALLTAVRSMSRAAVSLTTADLTPALASEKRALTQLQEAFARARFLMRALSQREQLDLTRRQSGALDSIARVPRNVPDGERDVHAAAWRGVLADLLRPTLADDKAHFTNLAERVLQIDASSTTSQRIADWLMRASAQPALRDSATLAVNALLRDATRPAAASGQTLESRRLRDALDRARRTGRPQ